MEGGGIRVRAESGRPRLTLLDQMSAITADGRELAGLTLDDILGSQKRAAPAPAPDAVPAPAPEPPGRTLLDIIRDEDPMAGSCKSFAAANRDRRSWRSFKDRLRLKRSGSGAAWTSSVHVPTSDILIPTSRSMVSRRNSVGSLFAESPQDAAHPDDAYAAAAPQGFRPQISRRSSCRFGTSTSFASDPTRSFDDNSAGNDGVVTDANSSGSSPIRRPSLSHAPSLRHQISRRHSTRFSPAMDDGGVSDPTEPLPPQREGSRRLSAVLAEERSLSAREAVVAQEAAEAASAAAAAAAADESETDSPVAATEAAPAVRMSLMDLLEETDRQMGLVGSRYMFEDDEDYEEEEEEELGSGAVAVAGAEQNCCVCMVRHKGAAFIPCGHTFCRLCSRELWVSRGNCPLCNGFILEILDIF